MEINLKILISSGLLQYGNEDNIIYWKIQANIDTNFVPTIFCVLQNMKLQPLVKSISPKYQVILDATWYLKEPLKAKQEFPKKHIPKARYIDINQACNSLSTLPHMLPTPFEFQTIMSKLGIKRTDNVLIYDQSMFSAPRIYWMLKVFGHENVSVLDGGMQKYLKDGGVLGTEPEPIKETEYPLVELNEKKVIDYLEMMKHIQDFSTQEFTIIDARSAPRFAGHEPEPRPIPSGHCPGAINLPFGKLLTSEGTFLEKDELRAVFEDHMVNLNAPIVNMCGSGVTACVVDLALDILDFNYEKRVYDGSWTEYATNPKSPIVVYPN